VSGFYVPRRGTSPPPALSSHKAMREEYPGAGKHRFIHLSTAIHKRKRTKKKTSTAPAHFHPQTPHTNIQGVVFQAAPSPISRTPGRLRRFTGEGPRAVSQHTACGGPRSEPHFLERNGGFYESWLGILRTLTRFLSTTMSDAPTTTPAMFPVPPRRLHPPSTTPGNPQTNPDNRRLMSCFAPQNASKDLQNQ